MKLIITEKQLKFLVEQEKPTVYQRKSDPYEYKYENNIWFGRKKGTENWLDLTKYPKSLEILNREFPQGKSQKPATQPVDQTQDKSLHQGSPKSTQQPTDQQQNVQQKTTDQSNVNKNDLDSIINAVTNNANIAKFMKQQTKIEGNWKSGTLNYDNNNPANMLPDASSKKVDPNLTVTKRSRYAKFSTPELGFTAYLNKILRWSKGAMPAYDASTKMIVNPQYNKGREHKPYAKGQVPTLAQFIYQWAPPTENNSENYIDVILKVFPGKTSETPMTELLGI